MTDSDSSVMAAIQSLQVASASYFGKLENHIEEGEHRLGARVDGLEKRLDRRIDVLETRMDARFDSVEARLDTLETRRRR